MKKFSNNQNKPFTMINMQNVRSNPKNVKMFTFIKTKNGRKLQSKGNVQNLAVTSSRQKMATYIGEIETDCESEETSVEISDDQNDNVNDENQVNNEELEIKSQNQLSPKTEVRTTRYGRVVKQPRRYDEYDVIKEREMLYIDKHCLSEKHVYQTLLVLRLLSLTAGNTISQSYYIEYV